MLFGKFSASGKSASEENPHQFFRLRLITIPEGFCQFCPDFLHGFPFLLLSCFILLLIRLVFLAGHPVINRVLAPRSGARGAAAFTGVSQNQMIRCEAANRALAPGGSLCPGVIRLSAYLAAAAVRLILMLTYRPAEYAVALVEDMAHSEAANLAGAARASLAPFVRRTYPSAFGANAVGIGTGKRMRTRRLAAITVSYLSWPLAGTFTDVKTSVQR